MHTGRLFTIQGGTVPAVTLPAAWNGGGGQWGSLRQQGHLGSHPSKVIEGCKGQPNPAALPRPFLLQSRLGGSKAAKQSERRVEVGAREPTPPQLTVPLREHLLCWKHLFSVQKTWGRKQDDPSAPPPPSDRRQVSQAM